MLHCYGEAEDGFLFKNCAVKVNVERNVLNGIGNRYAVVACEVISVLRSDINVIDLALVGL